MSKCRKSIFDFCGNINSNQPTTALSIERFQFAYLSAVYRYSAWVAHFKDGPIIDDFMYAYIRYLGVLKTMATSVGIYQSRFNFRIVRILSDFDETLTWNGYAALTKENATSENEYFGYLDSYMFKSSEGSGFGEDGSHGSYFQGIGGGSGHSLYGVAFLATFPWTYPYTTTKRGEMWMDHPAILTTPEQIMDNYLLLSIL